MLRSTKTLSVSSGVDVASLGFHVYVCDVCDSVTWNQCAGNRSVESIVWKYSDKFSIFKESVCENKESLWLATSSLDTLFEMWCTKNGRNVTEFWMCQWRSAFASSLQDQTQSTQGCPHASYCLVWISSLSLSATVSFLATWGQQALCKVVFSLVKLEFVPLWWLGTRCTEQQGTGRGHKQSFIETWMGTMQNTGS